MNIDERIERILLKQFKAVKHAPDLRSAPKYTGSEDIKQLIRDVLKYVATPMWEEAEHNVEGNEIAWAVRLMEAKIKELGL